MPLSPSAVFMPSQTTTQAPNYESKFVLSNLLRYVTNYFCKTLTATDTSTHGDFSVPRRPTEKVSPPLDYSHKLPAREVMVRDLHDNKWKFWHIFRGQPKGHLLNTCWSVFVNTKRLVTGDSVHFIWNDKNQLLLGIRRASRPQTVMLSSVLLTDTHVAATNSRFTISYNPRYGFEIPYECTFVLASPSEFVIPLAKYVKAVYHTCVSVAECPKESLFNVKYMDTITGICDLDPTPSTNSHWWSVGSDKLTGGERQPRVSLWQIEPLTTFPMYPSPFPLRLKRPLLPGLPSFHGLKEEDMRIGMSSPLMFVLLSLLSPWMRVSTLEALREWRRCLEDSISFLEQSLILKSLPCIKSLLFLMFM
ncbi:unnamed protein product [Thlaspi arvense]|uniref:TF-B3 domain-containing protein n=1 Tax=Thlaspi arvense TaxID=13288 RepID=A0AAU9T9C1_THLAR|nr:unnamed protein product [Thlaspi arvense]